MSKLPKASKNQKNSPDLTSLRAQLEDVTAALQRERADAINIRRQHEEQINRLRTTVKINIIRELLPVIDNLDRSLKHVPKALENDEYVKGIQGVAKLFDKTLTDMGVTRIATVGSHFNPHFHEAVSMEEGSDGTHEIVSEELQAGYSVEDEVIRPAMVKVKLQDSHPDK